MRVTRALDPKGPPTRLPRGPKPSRKAQRAVLQADNHPSTGQGPNQLSKDLQGEHLGINLNKELIPSKLCLVLDPLRGELERQLSDGRARHTVGHGRNPGPSASGHPCGATTPDAAHRL